MQLIVIIPCLNEQKTIKGVIESIPKKIDGVKEIIVVVVDDGSSDETARIANESGAHVIQHKKNRGVGAAFQSGIEYALTKKPDILVNIDGDGQFTPGDIPKLLQPILNREAEFVTASRFMKKEFYPTMSKVKFYGNRFMSWFISKLTGHKFYDVSCGFRAYTFDTILKLNLFGKFTYTQETFIDLAFKDIRIKEIPLKIRGVREFGKSRVASNIIKYAYNTFKIILRTYRDYKPLKLFAFISIIFLILGVGFGTFLMSYYIKYRMFTPHKWSGFVSMGFLGLSFFFFVIGFILDMLTRFRKNQDQILYILKKGNIKT